MTADLGLGWMADAACRGLTRLMYPPMRQGRAPQDGVYDEALAICATCPVVDDCRAWAETQPDQWRSTGVVAGLTPNDRNPVCGDAVGTLAGHTRHQRAPEQPCPACRDAMNAYTREYRARKKAA